MEEKTDKVVGYIEYLGAGGMIGEIVPYTSVEKFKDAQHRGYQHHREPKGQ